VRQRFDTRRNDRARRNLHRRTFGEIYRHDRWRIGGESASGPGSSLARTAELRPALAALLTRLGARSLLDAGCGDFNWMRAAELPVSRYIGVDVVPGVVARVRELHGGRGRRFLCRDVTFDRLPRVDVVLCRDCLIHFPDGDVHRAVANFRRSGSTWLLATTFESRPVNEPVVLGDWRTVNLEAPPFGFPPPELALDDIPAQHGDAYLDKRLGLWRLADLG